MRAMSLFSGVGGFELGLERAGIETILQVEQDPWCLSVLERHWPTKDFRAGVMTTRAGPLTVERFQIPTATA
jgi:DNA (cytosine-5)-methyltransferase 1